MIRLDWLSCILTVLSTLLIGRKLWHGWIIAGLNSIVVCIIGLRTGQFGFLPANVFCIGLYAFNLRAWHLQSPAVPPPSSERKSWRREPQIALVINPGPAFRPHEINLSRPQVLVGFLSALSTVGLLVWAFLKLWLFEP